MSIEIEDNKMIFTDENENSKEFEILGFIEDKEKRYIVYTDNRILTNNNIGLSVSKFSVDNNGEILLSDVNQEELNFVLNKLQERLV